MQIHFSNSSLCSMGLIFVIISNTWSSTQITLSTLTGFVSPSSHHCELDKERAECSDNIALFRGRTIALQWRHYGRDGISNHQHHDCLLNRSFRRISKKISQLRVTGLCEGNSPVTGEFPAQRASGAENISIWWRHNGQATVVYGQCFNH